MPCPSPPAGSTGSGGSTMLRPSPCRSGRQGGRVPHRRETERDATGVHAGGTPALPGCRLDDAVEDIRRATSLKADGCPLENCRFPAIRRPHPPRADHTRVKQILFQIGTTEPPFLPRTFEQTRFALPSASSMTRPGTLSRNRKALTKTEVTMTALFGILPAFLVHYIRNLSFLGRRRFARAYATASRRVARMKTRRSLSNLLGEDICVLLLFGKFL